MDVSRTMERLKLEVDEDTFLRCTSFVNETDGEIEIKYNGAVYALKPKSDVDVLWRGYGRDDISNALEIGVTGVQLTHAISLQSLYDSIAITIFEGVDNVYSFETLTEKAIFSSTKAVLSRMEELLNKVSIWRYQCEHLVREYRERVGIMLGRLDILIKAARDPGSLHSLRYPHSAVKFAWSKFMCCMLEGEALLLFCSESDNFAKAAFALSTPPSSIPTFSRFGVVLRELDWTLDLICCLDKKYLDICSPFHGWKWNWCKQRCRLIFRGDVGTEIGVKSWGVEADGHRQIEDREALRAHLENALQAQTEKALQTNRRWLWTPHRLSNKSLEDILRKRLLATSDTLGPSSIPDGRSIDSTELTPENHIASGTTSYTPQPILVPDCFVIDSTEDIKNVKHIASGSFKTVSECKWLGEAVAVAHTKWPKEQVEAEAGLLARVQHPNVVELWGYAYKDDIRDPEGTIVTEIMEQDLETLISQQVRSLGFESFKQPPFPLPVVIDIALQIVEAMIHLKECGVLHRDLKPKNCLASLKRWENPSAGCCNTPTYYSIKVIDFGEAKKRGQDSYFHTYKRGTPFHMAPELYGRSENCPYTWSADVYSFGITLYEIFTGKAPFENFTNFKVVQEFICGGNRPLFPFECPIELKDVIERCWSQDPANRPTFQEIRHDLWLCKLNAFLPPAGEVLEVDFGLLVTPDQLQKEFKRILTEQSHPICLPEQMAPSLEFDYPPEVVQRLQDIIAKLAGSAHSYINVYQEIRGDLCQESLKALGVSYMDSITPQSVDAIPWDDLQNMIQKWTEQLEVVVKMLYAGERRLARQVFKNVGQSVWVEILRDLAAPAIGLFLRFGESFAASERSPVKLFELLKMFESMEKCEHSVIQVFDGQACGEIRARYRELLKQVVYAAGKSFWEIDDWVKDQQEGVAPDGRVMRLCSWVVNYLKYVLNLFPKTLSKVLRIAQSWEVAGAQEKGLAEGIILILQTLEGRVEVWAQEFHDPALRHIFLMNNMYYIRKRVKNSELGPLLGEDWISDIDQKVSQNTLKYQREGWQRVLQQLNREGLQGSSSSKSSSRELVRQRLRAFTAAFDEAIQAQSKWIIPEQDLRDGTLIAINQMVVPAYRNFLGHFGYLLDGRFRDTNKYIKYSPEVTEAMLGDLFTGSN